MSGVGIDLLDVARFERALERRLDEKRKQAQTKRLRRPPDE